MPKNMVFLPRLLPRFAFAAAAGALLIVTGCKPTTPRADRTDSSSDHSDGGSASRQPSADDFNAFFKTLMPSEVRVSDLKTDPPVRMFNTSPDSNTWVISVKITLTPVEDLLAQPAPEDARVINDLVNELNNVIAWRNAYVRSPYARTYGAFEVKAPVSPVPQLLVIQQAKDRPLPPLYGKITAEWQVDHWQFFNGDMELPKTGQPRSSFTGGPTMVKGSPEAEAFVTAQRKAIIDAKEKQAAIESNYSKDLLAAVQPGSVYAGKITHRLGVLPCEIRFLDQPLGDTQTATFEVRLLNDPSYQFVYSAKLVTPMPVGAPVTSTSGESFRIADESSSSPVGDLIVNFVRGTGGGKDEEGKILPGMMLRGQLGKYTPHDQSFVVLGHQIHGLMSRYSNGEFILTAEQKQ